MDLFEYVKWRGDIPFNVCPLNAVDALILCQLSYLDFGGIVSPLFNSKILLSDAAEKFADDRFEERKELGVLINPRTVELLFVCAQTKRFGSLLLTGFRNTYSKKEEEQFSALTFLCTQKNADFAFEAFRGTDDTIIGWKEDFNLAFMSEVKAQKDSLLYLEESIKNLKRVEHFCGGHSKGGNLAIFAGAKLNEKAQKCLKQIYNFDGPGFLKSTLQQENFQAALKKAQSYFPQESIVGMFFEHDSTFKVLKSSAKNIMQHDPIYWQTQPDDFELCENLSESSLFLNKVFNEWFVELTVSKREQFVEVLFGALESTQADTNSELAENWGRNGVQIVKSLSRLDKDIRDSALDSAIKFLKLAGQHLPEYLKIISKKTSLLNF